MVVQCGYNEAVKSLTMFNSIKIPPRSPGKDGGAARGGELRSRETLHGNKTLQRRGGVEVDRQRNFGKNSTIFGEVLILVEMPNM